MAKKRKRRRSSENFKDKHPISPYYLLPIMFVIAIIPLIVFGKIVEIDGLEAQYWISGSLHLDFFQYYKSIYFVVAVVIAIFVTLYLYLSDKISFVKSKYYRPMLVYVAFVILSYLFTDDFTIATRGHVSMFQGVFVLLGYIGLIVLVFNLVKTDRHLKFLVGAFVFVGIVIGLLGITQYFGFDFFQTNFGKSLILPSLLDPQADTLKFGLEQFGIYATLYNPNYVGSFAALMIPLSFALYFYQKDIKFAVLALAFVGLMVFVGFGSNSRAGILGVISAIILIAIIFRKETRKKPLYIAIPFALLVIFGIGLNIVTDGSIVAELKSMSLTDAIEDAKEYSDNKVFFESIEIDGYTGIIRTEESDIKLVFNGFRMDYYTLDDELLDTIVNYKEVTFVDEAYSEFSFRKSTTDFYYLTNIYDRWFRIYVTSDGLKLQGLSDELYVPQNPDQIEFLETYGQLFSARAFIWSRSIPMVKDYLLIGAGPDMYTLVYPQDDFAGKLNFIGIKGIVSKPHNMYLQTSINTGFISLIALLTLFTMYIIDSFKLYYNRTFNTLSDYLGAGMLASVVAYLVSGVFNDQVIMVAPLFYVMLGLGIAVNRMIKKAELIQE